MLKKFLAGLTAIVLSLGMVAITAAPASAHHSDVSATFECSSTTSGTITWSVHNWNGGKVGRVWASTDGIVPVGTLFDSDQTKTFTQTITGAGTYALSVTMRWYDGSGDQADLSNWNNETSNSGSIKLKASDFAGCDPNEQQKVTICHANEGSKGWTTNTVSVNSIINVPNGHRFHEDDIIPAFTYSGGSFPGLNNDAYGLWVLANGCSNEVVPAAATISNAVCTGPGTWGQGSYVIPTSTGVRYLVSIDDGPWVEKSANTYPVAVGTKVEIKAEALDGYELKGNDNQWEWSKTIGKPSTCDVDVTPVKPDTTQAICTADGQAGGAGYTIVSVTGVRFEKSANGSSGWTEVLPNTYPVADGTFIWIRAVALDGYELAGNDSNYKWKLEFADYDETKCQVPTAPNKEYSQCTGPGTSSTARYYVPTDPGVVYTVYIDDVLFTTWVPGWNDVTGLPKTVKIVASAAAGNVIVSGSQTEWTYDFVSAGRCVVDAPVKEPVFTDSVCEEQTTGSTQGGYFIPTTDHVIYYVQLDGGAVEVALEGVFVPVDPGTDVQLSAAAESGYQLTGDHQGPWNHEFADPGTCLDEAPTDAVTAVEQTCVVDEEVPVDRLVAFATGTYVSGWIVIPSTPNVDYFIAPDLVNPAPAGANEREPGMYHVIAVAQPGYVLTGTTEWDLEILEAEPCGDLVTEGVVLPTATYVQTTCTAAGSYTLGAEPIENASGIIWTVSGGLPNTLGTHAVTSGGTVTVTATQAGPDIGFSGDDDGFMEWSFPFTGLPADCLPTLALTGTGVATSGLGLAGLLTLGGILLIAAHRRRGVLIER